MVGPGVLGFVGAPALISLVVAALLYVKVARRSARAGRAALCLAWLSCAIGVVGLVVAGLLMLLAPVLTLGAVAATPLPPDPNDPLVQSGGVLSRLSSNL
jgi:hypothetical protein